MFIVLKLTNILIRKLFPQPNPRWILDVQVRQLAFRVLFAWLSFFMGRIKNRFPLFSALYFTRLSVCLAGLTLAMAGGRARAGGKRNSEIRFKPSLSADLQSL